MFKDLKMFQAELDRYHDVNYASKVAIDCAKAKGDLINHLHKVIRKEAQKKFHKTREDKKIEKVIALENKVKVLDDIVYKTGQSVQMMNMLNRNCKTSFDKPEYLNKAQRANPRLYDIGCYTDNLALVLAPESDEKIHLAQEIRSKLSDLIRPFDYKNLNIVYKTGQSVQMMNMLNRNCKTSFDKPEYLNKAQRANPRLYDIGCYTDNLALVLAPESDETIRLAQEIRSKLSDLIRPFDYKNLNNLYDLFVPQREKSSE
ncbi:hypothetical protein Tco_0540699 [Tanacetum coccineum]